MALSALARFLADDAGRDHEWGTHDCGLRLADWIAVRTGIDPAASVRGTYHDRESFEACHGRGGLLRLAARLCARAGLKQTRTPCEGDIAVLAAGPRGGRLLIGAIRTAKGWSVPGGGADGTAARGVTLVEPDTFTLVAAWRIDAHVHRSGGGLRRDGA